LNARREKLVAAIDEERGRLVGLTTSAAFVVGIFVAFRPERGNATVTALYAAGLLPFVVLMVGLGPHNIVGITIRRPDAQRRMLRYRLRRERVDLLQALYAPSPHTSDATVSDEREWLAHEIALLKADEWPGLGALLDLLRIRQRVFELASGLLAVEVAWLVTVSLLAPFLD
jgi:hypothetical protein